MRRPIVAIVAIGALMVSTAAGAAGGYLAASLRPTPVAASVPSTGVCVSFTSVGRQYVTDVKSPVREGGVLACSTGNFVPVNP